MLVEKNTLLLRKEDNTVFRVMVADEETFVVCKARYDPASVKWVSDYSCLLPFPNKDTTLEKLGFEMPPVHKV